MTDQSGAQDQPLPPAPGLGADSATPPPQWPGAPSVQQGHQLADYGQSTVGRVRGTGISILLSVVTLGIYTLVWFYQVHTEMKRHKGTGLGGGIALLLALLVGIVMPYITSAEVGELYERRRQPKPVSGPTGLWYFPGIVILIGPIVWFVKTNGALNAYWRSLGAR